MAKRCYILVHYSGEIINTYEGVNFYSQNPQFMIIRPYVIQLELWNTILQRIGQQNNKQITQVFYQVPIAIGKDVIRYRSWQLSSNDDVSLMFDCHTQYPEIRTIELFIVLEESHFSSSGSALDRAHVGMS